jgi:Phosphotransferase enzyme family
VPLSLAIWTRRADPISRTGVEPKPRWRDLPATVRTAVAETTGTSVARATRAFGGYGPSPTFRLRLANGRRVFLKGLAPDATEPMRQGFLRELRVYEEVHDRIDAVAPTVHGHFSCADWQILLLEDLGPKSVPPWRHVLTHQILRETGRWHRRQPADELPDWVPRPDEWFHREAPWGWIEEPSEVARRASVAGPSAQEAAAWFQRSGVRLAEVTRGLLEAAGGSVMLHGDIRSDNLRWTRGRLYLFDWSSVRAGAAELDLAMFAQSITVEGGWEPEQVVSWYGESNPVDAATLDSAVCWAAAFFADRAWRPDVPGLPRLRRFQRQQLRVTLGWAAQRLQLPSPGWLTSMAIVD